jgi:6-phosphofructokinase 1
MASQDINWSHIENSPAMAFGSSRLRLPELKTHPEFYQKLFNNFKEKNIGTVFCNGGNNSQHVAAQIEQAAATLQQPLQVIGIPKTIDNDVLHTDTAIGFGSAAKYTAISCMEVSLDLASMCHTNSKVLIFQTMGRNVGWLAAASAIAKQHPFAGPHLILVPEASFSIDTLLQKIQYHLRQHNHVVICLAEGITHFNELYPNQPTPAHKLGALIQQHFNLSSHIVIPDYLQRAARHIASSTDIEQSIAMTQHAMKLAKNGQSGIMITVDRISESPYAWKVNHVPLSKVAGHERSLPREFLTRDEMHINQQGIDYIQPLIQGESLPIFKNGIPCYSNEIYQCIEKIQQTD